MELFRRFVHQKIRVRKLCKFIAGQIVKGIALSNNVIFLLGQEETGKVRFGKELPKKVLDLCLKDRGDGDTHLF